MTNVVPLPMAQSLTFEDFWAVYPRRKDKLDAMRAWNKAIKIASPEEIIEGAKRYAKVAEAPYIKLPATFLNKGSWMDEEAAEPTITDPHESRLQLMAKMVRKADEGSKFAADYVKNNVTPQDMEEMKRKGLV